MAKNDFAVIGLGRFGTEVALQLQKNGRNVMVIDESKELIERASKVHDLAITCDASDLNSLSETGVANVSTVIVAISNIESSIMICANLRELGMRDIIAKAINHTHRRVLKTMGISRVVIPEIEIADRVAFQALFNVGVDVTNIGQGFSWVKTGISNPEILHKSLKDLDIRKKYDVTIMMIQRRGTIISPPTPDTAFELGDVITFMCQSKKIETAIKMFVSNKNAKAKSKK